MPREAPVTSAVRPVSCMGILLVMTTAGTGLATRCQLPSFEPSVAGTRRVVTSGNYGVRRWEITRFLGRGSVLDESVLDGEVDQWSERERQRQRRRRHRGRERPVRHLRIRRLGREHAARQRQRTGGNLRRCAAVRDLPTVSAVRQWRLRRPPCRAAFLATIRGRGATFVSENNRVGINVGQGAGGHSSGRVAGREEQRRRALWRWRGHTDHPLSAGNALEHLGQWARCGDHVRRTRAPFDGVIVCGASVLSRGTTTCP
jgi:hypothetical protein